MAIVAQICDLLDALRPLAARRRRSLIRFVADRPGHDRRYAIDPSKIEAELGWKPAVRFAEGLAATIDWYVAHGDRWTNAQAMLGRRGVASA